MGDFHLHLVNSSKLCNYVLSVLWPCLTALASPITVISATFFPRFEPRGLHNDAANLWIIIPVTVYGVFVFTVALWS